MAFVPPHDRVLEHSTSNSQTIFTVTGAVDTSFNAFSASMSIGDTTLGGVIEPGVAFKTGVLTYSNTNEVTVTTAVESKGTFSSSGIKEVFMGLPASRALNAGATLQASPADPTGATTEKMMGLGGTCTITPVQSTRVRVEFQGQAQNASGGGICSVQLRYGTGSAPANAAAVTGTTLGSKPHSLQGSANEAVFFRVGGVITGLSPGTTYWFDLAVGNIATGTTATVTNLSCDANEF